MLDYAVTLEFDKESEDKIQKIMDEVVSVTGCDYMKKALTERFEGIIVEVAESSFDVVEWYT